MTLKLSQNQVWKSDDKYLRIVSLDRREVRYKAIHDLLSGEGEHHHVSKKEFCRLIKGATLLTPEEVRASWLQSAGTPPDDVLPPEPAPGVETSTATGREA